jgi:FkbM family methyltransferase
MGEMPANDLAARALLWYTEHVPWHRGKASVVLAIKSVFHLYKEGDREVTRLDLRWVLNPADHGESLLFWVGSYDIWERYHIERLLPKGSVMFDIGTRFGIYALTLAHRVPTATIYCFEPNLDNYIRLTRNISLNHLQNLRPFQLGLGDWVGTARIVVNNDTDSGASSLAEGEGTHITTLDRFCEEQGIQRLDFLKVDIEGFEPRLLKGGRKSLERFKPTMLIELNTTTLARAGSSVEELLGMLRSLGYEFYVVQRDRLVAMGSLADRSEYLVNCFCLHPQNRPADFLRAT